MKTWYSSGSGYLSVPRKSMCSRKWARPSRSGGLSKLPTLTLREAAALSLAGSEISSTSRPLARVRWRYWRSSLGLRYTGPAPCSAAVPALNPGGAAWIPAVAAGDAASPLPPSPSGAQAASSNRFNRTRGRRVGRRIAWRDSLLGRRGSWDNGPATELRDWGVGLGQPRPPWGKGRLRKGGPAFNRR